MERAPLIGRDRMSGLGEDAAADNHVARRVQLEHEHLAWLKRAEVPGGRCPEIDLARTL